jgi:hypothetical protein
MKRPFDVSKFRSKREPTTNAATAKSSVEKFAKMPLEWTAAAAKAVGSPATIVLTALQYAHWKAKSDTFSFSNVNLKGVRPDVKARVLRDLEDASLAKVQYPTGCAPIVTLPSTAY